MTKEHLFKMYDKLCDEYDELCRKIKELQIKLESSIEIPCEIGDNLYFLMTDGSISKGKVVDYTHFISCGFCVVVVSEDGMFNKMNIPFDDLDINSHRQNGRASIFFSMEDAEAKLREIKEKRNTI